MGMFTEHDLSNVFISEMSIHLVGGQIFIPQKKMSLEHVEFFKDRVGDIDDEPVFKFDDKSLLKETLQKIVDAKLSFEEGAQHISEEFNKAHVSSAVEGAFFVIELRDVVKANTYYYCLIKYDYSEAIEHQDGGQEALLRKIAKAFVADKKTMQKSALIQVIGKKVQIMISARDRMKRGLILGDYFEKFLGVERDVTDLELNERAFFAVREILTHLSSIESFLPNGGLQKALKVAKESISGQPKINQEVIFNAVILAAGDPDDELKIEDINKLVERKIKTNKISGLSFDTDLSIFSKPAIRRVKTKEHVSISFPDIINDSFVKIIKPTKEGESIKIEITTSEILEDVLINS